MAHVKVWKSYCPDAACKKHSGKAFRSCEEFDDLLWRLHQHWNAVHDEERPWGRAELNWVQANYWVDEYEPGADRADLRSRSPGHRPRSPPGDRWSRPSSAAPQSSSAAAGLGRWCRPLLNSGARQQPSPETIRQLNRICDRLENNVQLEIDLARREVFSIMGVDDPRGRR